MLSLNRHQAALEKIVNNHEKHGKKKVTAFSFPFRFRCDSDFLESISKGLRDSIYRKPQAGDQQSLIGETKYTVLICPELAGYSLTHEFTGFEMAITPAGSESNDDPAALFLVDVKLGAFHIKPYDGGSCDVSFKATCRIDLDQDAVKALRYNEVGDVILTLVPPTVQPQTDPDADDNE